MTALFCFIALTTLTSPTADAIYCPPCFLVTSDRALVEERLLTVLPFMYAKYNLLLQPTYILPQT